MWMPTFVVLLSLAPLQAPSQPASVKELPDPTSLANEYYVSARYPCRDNSDQSDRGSCDITTYSSSCQAALQAHNADIQSRGDVCVHCVKNETDNTRHQAGSPTWIHLGPCRGFP